MATRAALTTLLALTLALVYGGTVSGLVRQWTSSPDASYGIVLAAVAIAVLWGRRAALARAVSEPSTGRAGLFVLAVGLMLYLVGQLGADVYLTRMSMIVVSAGALWFAAGTPTIRVAAAPLIFLAIAIPLPTLVVNAVTLPLQLTASQIAEQTLTLGGVAVLRNGNILELPSGALEVAEACSGLRSAVSLAAVAVMLAWTQPSWPRRIAVVVASVPIAIGMNGLRIVATALASEAWGSEIATGSWHTFTGWVTFVLSLLLLMALQRTMSRSPARSAELTPAVTA